MNSTLFTLRTFLVPAFIAFSLQITSQDKLNVILDADTGNEVDDLYALSRALIEPTWNVLALNATHWQTSQWSIDETMENSHRLNQMILGYLGSDVQTRRGGVARMFDWGDKAQHSAAAYEIIAKALEVEPNQKLDVVALGALTNVASAVYINPEISSKIRLHWLGTTYDFEKDILRKNDFNCMMDIQALDHLLFSDVEMHIIPVSVAAKMVFSYEETEKELSGLHPLADFILRRWDDHLDGGRKERVIWDLALITGLIRPEWITKKKITTSRDNGSREIFYTMDIDAEKIKNEFFEKLRDHLQNQ